MGLAFGRVLFLWGRVLIFQKMFCIFDYGEVVRLALMI